MKRDIFNGKISAEYRGYVVFTLSLATLIFVGCGALFCLVPVVYDSMDAAARVLLFAMGGLCGLAAILFPLFTWHFIRIYPSHRRITRLLIKEDVFRK